MNKRKLGFIIQARLGSTRLPNKILKLFNGKPLIIHIFERIEKFKLPIIIATTDNVKDDTLFRLLQENDIQTFRGSENNVLERFIQAAKQNEITDIIRICSDNPFLDLEYLEKLINIWEYDSVSDYLSFEFKEKPVILSHFGIFAEIVKVDALFKVAYKFPDNKLFSEHVTNGVYLNTSIFKINLLNLDEELTPYEGIRLTIDTQEDFDNVSTLILKMENKNFKQIANFITSEKLLFRKMKQIIINNQK